MPYVPVSEFVFDCEQCDTRCDGISKGVYNFNNDVTFSEFYEQHIIGRINQSGKYVAFKCATPGYPDIEVRNADNTLFKYIEVKVQQRTFMQVQKYLPASNLLPSETIALNESDLLRYFQIQHQDAVPIIIVWVLLNRLCMVEPQTHQLYYQHLPQLQTIYNQCQSSRRFKRKSGDGDVVDGMHKGVMVNYHFSLKELKRWV